MHFVLLSGGAGQRLWPLSTDARPKQFLKIFRHENGTLESMAQRMYRSIVEMDKSAKIVITASESQIPMIREQLGKDVSISVEPCRRDTFPAIVLAAAYLKYEKGIDENEPIVVCPVDPYVEKDYFTFLEAMCERVTSDNAELVLMGVEPTYPCEKYGYIIPVDQKNISKVVWFKEKPTQSVAKKYIEQGALWNGGVFAFRLGYILRRTHALFPFADYQDLIEKYAMLDSISFDYAVAEREKNVEVMRFTGKWMDVGTWNTLTEVMDSCILGKAVFDENCKSVYIVNETNLPVLCMGLKNIVVAVGSEGILISDKEMSSNIKPLVKSIQQCDEKG